MLLAHRLTSQLSGLLMHLDESSQCRVWLHVAKECVHMNTAGVDVCGIDSIRQQVKSLANLPKGRKVSINGAGRHRVVVDKRVVGCTCDGCGCERESSSDGEMSSDCKFENLL